MSIGLPQITYTPVSTLVTLSFQRGPQDFRCPYSGRVHDNLSTAGWRERVVEALDTLISFNMSNMSEWDQTDLSAWYTFMAWALGGGQFNFYPNISIATEYYHCVCENTDFEPVRVGPGYYKTSFKLRVVPDSQAPAGGPGQVMRRFYGVATP